MKIGLCGFGYWGKNLARVLNQLRALSAICDNNKSNLNRAKILYPNIKLYNSLNSMLKSDCDGVVIATPPHTHFNLGMKVLYSRKHVCIEKPMAISYSHAKTLNKYATNLGKTLQIGHTFVYNSGIRKIKEYIDNKTLGQVKYISIQQLNLGKYQRGGVILDLAAHGLSIADYLLDGAEVKNIKVAKGYLRFSNIIDWASIVVYYKNGALLHLNLSWLHPIKIRKFTVVGNKKMVIFDDVNEPRIQLIDKSVRTQERQSSWGNSIINYNTGSIIIPNIKFKEPLKEEMSDFIHAIKTNSKPITDGKQGLRVVKILEKLL